MGNLGTVNACSKCRHPCSGSSGPQPHHHSFFYPRGLKVFSVIDLANVFCSVPVHPESKFWLVFTFKGKKYTRTRMPQGYTEAPTIFSSTLQACFSGFSFKHGSTLVQYVGNLLVCILDTRDLLIFLSETGNKASLFKAQLVKECVRYLGHDISANSRSIGTEQVAAIQKIPKPRMKKEIMSFLGCTGYCRSWIPVYARLAQPLSDVTHASGLTMIDHLTWTPDGEKSFVNLKTALMLAPALGLSDMTKGFTLTVDEKHGFYSAVLFQAHSDCFKPVAYYSQCLTSVARGLPACLCAVAA
uniref:ribonuclease H n=1 Tax=Lepisosteus oculatus TaxID=7918 RepID=W5NMD9_LEPOC